jgi:hypothetical protein
MIGLALEAALVDPVSYWVRPVWGAKHGPSIVIEHRKSGRNGCPPHCGFERVFEACDALRETKLEMG